MHSSLSSQPPSIPFARLIAFGIAVKFVVDTGVQIFSPYLPLFAQGLGVDAVVMGRLVSIVSAMGIIAPVMGVVADRLGYRPVMRVALFSAAVGALLMAGSNNIWMAILSLVLMGAGFATFTPLLHAYLSTVIPYGRRARAMGMVEYSWALASIIGLSLMGLLIALTNWRAPFFVLSGGLTIAWFAYGRLPMVSMADGPRPGVTFPNWRSWPQHLRTYFTLRPNARSAWSCILAGALNFFACLHVIIVHGVWLRQEYGLGPAQLGLIAFMLGVADLCGSVLVSLVADRVGKRRSFLLGTVGSLLVYLSLPFLDFSLFSAVFSLILLRFTFEFSIVSNFPLLSEQVPHQRGKVMTLSALFYLSSATLIGFTGPWAYTRFGVWGLGPVSAAAIVVSLWLIWHWVKEVGS